MATRREIPSANLPHYDLSALAERDHHHVRSRPSRLLGFTLSKDRTGQDFLFEEPLVLSEHDDVDAILKEKTGRTRAEWNEAGFKVDTNGS